MAVPATQIAALKAKGLSADKIDEYRAAFTMFDPDGTGILDVAKLGAVLNERVGQSYTAEDLAYMLRQFGEGPEVGFVEFALSMHEKMSDARYNEAFGDAFDLFDTGKTGELGATELIDGFEKLGEKLTAAEAEEMLKIAKKKDDFVKAMTAAAAATSSTGGGAAAGAGPAAAAAATPAAAGAGAAAPRPGGPPRPGGGPPGPGGPPRPGGGPPAPAGPPRPGARRFVHDSYAHCYDPRWALALLLCRTALQYASKTPAPSHHPSCHDSQPGRRSRLLAPRGAHHDQQGDHQGQRVSSIVG